MGAVVVLSGERCHCGHDEGDHSQNRTCRFCWRRCPDIAAKIERSSLGTPEAQALRATVSDEHAARIVARAKELADAEQGAGDVEALAEVIWTTSRGDEGTISATSANLVARAILASDWLAAHDASLIAEAEARGERRAWGIAAGQFMQRGLDEAARICFDTAESLTGSDQ